MPSRPVTLDSSSRRAIPRAATDPVGVHEPTLGGAELACNELGDRLLALECRRGM